MKKEVPNVLTAIVVLISVVIIFSFSSDFGSKIEGGALNCTNCSGEAVLYTCDDGRIVSSRLDCAFPISLTNGSSRGNGGGGSSGGGGSGGGGSGGNEPVTPAVNPSNPEVEDDPRDDVNEQYLWISSLEDDVLDYSIDIDSLGGTEINDSVWIYQGSDSPKILKMGRRDSSKYGIGMIFNVTGINKGDYFTHARIVFLSEGSSNESRINLEVSGALSDNIGGFSQTNRPSTYTRTNNKVRWDINEEWVPQEDGVDFEYSTPDISPIINEIISKDGWDESSKTIAIFIDEMNGYIEGTNLIRAKDTEGGVVLELYRTPKDAFIHKEYLSRPTANSVTVSMIPIIDSDAYVEYGTSPGNYIYNSTKLYGNPAGESLEIVLSNLSEDIMYYYRVRARKNITGHPFDFFDEHSFVTRRARGAEFTFDVATDSHLYQQYYKGRYLGVQFSKENSYYTGIVQNLIKADMPDFMLDLGDTAYTHGTSDPSAVRSQREADLRYEFTRHYFENLSSNMSIFDLLGNHEGEAGFEFIRIGHSSNVTNWSTNSRLKYIPNPTNLTYPEGGGEYENYFAWTWGDALFVVIDVMRYTQIVPSKPEDWTLGEEQLNWLNETLTNSDAKWKFIFAEHLVGGSSKMTGGYSYGDGGAKYSDAGEQGKIQDMMEINNVQFFVSGHVHFLAHGTRNSVNYVTLPPYALLTHSDGRYDLYVGENSMKDIAGYGRVKVSPNNVLFEIVNYTSETIYTINLENTAPSVTLVSPDDGVFTGNSADFTFIYDDNEGDKGKSCDLYIDDAVKNSQGMIKSDSQITLSVSDLNNGVHNWYVKCYDGALYGESEIGTFIARSIEVSGLEIDYPLEYTLFQRHNDTTGQIKIRGTYAGQTSGIEASFNGGLFNSVDLNPSGGVFTGFLNSTIGNGTLIVRKVGIPTQNFSVDNIAVGDLFVVAGQSNAAGRGSQNNTFDRRVGFSSLFKSSGSWEKMADPTDVAPQRGGSFLPIVAEDIVENQSVPVSFIQVSKGGSSITSWQDGEYLYERMIQNISLATDGSMIIRTLLWYQGEADTNVNFVLKTRGNYTLHKNNLSSLASNFKRDTNLIESSIIVGVINKYTDVTADSPNSATRAGTDAIRKALLDSTYDNPNISLGPITYDIPAVGDGGHFSTPTEMRVFAERWTASILRAIYGVGDGRGPRIINAYLVETDAGNTTIRVNINDTSGLTILNWSSNNTENSKLDSFGWRIVQDDNTNLTDLNITSSRFFNATTIELNFTINISIDSKLWFASYTDANNTDSVRDTSMYSLPLEPIYDQPLIPFRIENDEILTNTNSVLVQSLKNFFGFDNVETNQHSNSYYDYMDGESITRKFIVKGGITGKNILNFFKDKVF